MFQTFPFNISYLRYIFWVVSSEGNNVLGALLLLPEDEGEHVGSGTLPALPPRTTLDLGGGGKIRPLGTHGSDCNNQVPFLDKKTTATGYLLMTLAEVIFSVTSQPRRNGNDQRSEHNAEDFGRALCRGQ